MSKYKVGDRVRIVSEWNEKTNEAICGSMDKWLGKVMTIREVLTSYGRQTYKMEEDKNDVTNGWLWNEACIAGLANKFNVGERYKVGDYSVYESGNIVEITGVEGHTVYYKTIKGKADIRQKFSETSIFAKNLIPVTEQNDSTKKIVITTDGKTTTAKMYDGKSCIKVSEARCCPSDTFDFRTGAEIAFDRLFEKSDFWGAFKAGKLCVKVDEENMPEFLKSCEIHGIKWASGKNATEIDPFEAQKDIAGLTLCEKYVYLTVVDGVMMYCEWNAKGLKEVGFSPEQFDWDAFKSHKLAVIVTKENIGSFLSEAEKHGCVWRSGLNPTEWNPAEEHELKKTYLYGIKNRDDFGEFGWCTVRPFKKVCVVEW